MVFAGRKGWWPGEAPQAWSFPTARRWPLPAAVQIDRPAMVITDTIRLVFLHRRGAGERQQKHFGPLWTLRSWLPPASKLGTGMGNVVIAHKHFLAGLQHFHYHTSPKICWYSSLGYCRRYFLTMRAPTSACRGVNQTRFASSQPNCVSSLENPTPFNWR